MRTPLEKITIAKPCQESWKGMSDHGQGKFCHSCQKAVVDMRALTDDQIIALLNSDRKVCGHLEKEQLSRLNPNLLYSRHHILFTSLLKITAGIAAIFSYSSVTAKPEYRTEQHPVSCRSIISSTADTTFSNVVSGMVTDHEKAPLIGVMIRVKGSNTGTLTDVQGKFSLLVDNEDRVLQFLYVGFKSEEVSVRDFRKNGVQPLLMQETLLGEITVVRAPLHKRILWRLKHPFKGLF